MALQSLKHEMQFPQKLAFQKNPVMYRAFADLLIALSSSVSGMIGQWECYDNARGAGVYQLLVDLRPRAAYGHVGCVQIVGITNLSQKIQMVPVFAVAIWVHCMK